MTTPVTYVRCIICGAEVAGGKRVQAHCLTDECNFQYARWMAEQRIERRGDCEVWTGQIRRGVGWVSVVTGRERSNSERKDYRVLDLRMGEFAPNQRYRRLCETPDCVKPSHNEVVRAKPRVRIRKPAPLSGHLDPTPLVARSQGMLLPTHVRHYIHMCGQRGWITVKKADEVCIDHLGIHPAQLWGEEFFTA